MMDRFTGRERNILIISIMVVFAAIIFNGIVIPLEEKRISLTEDITVQQIELDRDMRVIEKGKNLQVQYDLYKNKYYKAGTQEEVVTAVLSDIEKVAGQLGVLVTDLKPETVENNIYNQNFSVSLMVNSDLVDIVQFLYVLQQSPYVFDVRKIEFERSLRSKQSAIKARFVLDKTFILSLEDKRSYL